MMGWIFLILTLSTFVWLFWELIHNRWSKRKSKIGYTVLGLFWAISLVVIALRFFMGLGPISHMNDTVPWGVWIGLLQSGVALAAGGFVIAAAVHIFNLTQFRPILRPMVLTAFLGYSFVAATLFVEVGRPYRLWHPLVMWQHHSIMFEVAWCVTLYMTVLLIEFSPVIFERLRLPRMVHALHVAAIPIVIIGVILSTLHQSSMGSMFLIIPQKLYPLWISPLLPIFFLLSSVAAGLSMAIVESTVSHAAFDRSLDHDLLERLALAASILLFIYFTIKMADLFYRHVFHFIFANPAMGFLFASELILGVLCPALLFLSPQIRKKPRFLMLPAFLVAAGILMNRLNVSWFSMIPYTKTHYFPSWMEVNISLFIISVTITAFALAVRFLPVFPSHHTHDPN